MSCITTSHALGRELLSKPDGFITATVGNREYIIESYQRKSTHANIDDCVMHWDLKLKESSGGNIVR